jgi:hypothetical protein
MEAVGDERTAGGEGEEAEIEKREGMKESY